MRSIYLDCGMGAAGDMLTAALLELHPDQTDFLNRLNAIGIEGVHTSVEKMMKCGITCSHVTVKINGEEEESHDANAHEDHHHEHVQEHHHHDHGHEEHHHEHDHHHEEHDAHTHATGHHHSSMEEIKHQISHLHVSEKVKQDTLAVYELIAQAESKIHDTPVSEIHFHEVGTKDAIADIVAVCMLMEELQIEKVYASPVHVGSGQVKCAHGILPVPAPATANLLHGIPTYSGQVKGELCTPTGAALLKHFVSSFGTQPVMEVEKIGYGCGKKDFEQANCVRALLGNVQEKTEQLIELQCNLDDCTAENIGFAMERLFDEGALDVYTIPIGMKKNRPGILLTCMCKETDKDKMISLLFKHTTTLGIREYRSQRYTLHRQMEEVDTPYGKVHVKKVTGFGVERQKAEYEDLARLAKEQNKSIEDIRASIKHQ